MLDARTFYVKIGARMKRLSFCIALLALGCMTISAFAQNQNPVVASPISSLTLYGGAPPRSIDLQPVIQDADLSPVVRMNTVFGPMDFAIYDRQKPITATNFLRYVDEGRYFLTDPPTGQRAASFIHRAIVEPTPFVIQGGGWIATTNPSPPPGRIFPTQVLAYGAIQNEPGISNRRGTVAMAKAGDDPNSATSQWFVNLSDNSASLDTSNGGFTVFARVIGNGMDVADRIANLPIQDFSQQPNGIFTNVPVIDYTAPNFPTPANLVRIPEISRIASVPSPLTYSATSSNSAVVEVKVSDYNLLVTPKAAGTAQVTVTGTDVDGASVSQTFTVQVVDAPGRLVNIATRMQVRTEQEVLIGGFIMRGDAPKRVLVRAIGPSLSSQGIDDALADPVLELYDSAGNQIATNDKWANFSRQAIVDVGLAPTSDEEAAILTTLPSSTDGVAYTAIVRGANNTTGTALVEVYDLDSGAGSTLLNISTRGRVGVVNERLMIGGFFLGGTESKRILIRARGPSLSGISNTLDNPRLQLVDSNGTSITTNDDWEDSAQATEIQQSGLAPTNDREAAILRTLTPASYTAIVRGPGNAAGVATVEIYQLP